METITVLSTYVQDVLLKEDGTREACLAGPAYFIEQAFSSAAYPHTLVVGKQMRVEIEIRAAGEERGRVCGSPFSQPLPCITTPNLLISTLWREWEIDRLVRYAGRVFLDVQGLVRNPEAGFGAKKMWQESRALTNRLFCLKATAQELIYIPPEVVAEQKRERCLIVTRGAEGSQVFCRGNRYDFPAERLDGLSNTLGAGDTYLSNFVMAFLKTRDAEKAGRAATEKATEFLKTKIRRRSC